MVLSPFTIDTLKGISNWSTPNSRISNIYTEDLGTSHHFTFVFIRIRFALKILKIKKI